MKTVLIVDDDSQIRSIMNRVLSQNGYRVLLAGDGATALELLRRFPVDLVVTDLYMPRVDGIELAIRMADQTPAIPLLAISGGGYVEKDAALDRAQSLGVRGTLAKPFTPWELLEKVGSVLETRGPGGERHNRREVSAPESGR